MSQILPIDRTLTCRGCRKAFVLSAYRAQQLAERGWRDPSFCRECHAARQAPREEAADASQNYRTCVDCGELFGLTEDQERWFIERGLMRPKRCEACRRAKRAERAETVR